MRLILQRVLSAGVTVEGTSVGQIGPGLLVLLGVSPTDTPEDIQQLARKTLNIRLWETNGKSWNANVVQMGYEVLVVSQFTLFAVLKGNKPDFHGAMNPEAAEGLYLRFVQELKTLYREDRVATGAFRQYMNVSMVGDGPVTISLDNTKKSAEVPTSPELE